MNFEISRHAGATLPAAALATAGAAQTQERAAPPFGATLSARF
jgi:hypothetical protein